MLRGNVETRLRKVEAGEFDATLLAYSGLRRLGLHRHAKLLLDPIKTPPAGGQGALAITARTGDALHLSAALKIEHRATRIEISAERAFLAALDGSCRTPIGALGRWRDGRLTFVGESLTPDGAQRWRREGEAACATAEAAAALGTALGESLREEAGDALYVD
jgi:hydroxymethylbilane synthase